MTKEKKNHQNFKEKNQPSNILKDYEKGPPTSQCYHDHIEYNCFQEENKGDFSAAQQQKT